MKKVHFAGSTAVEHPMTGLLLVPGVNEVPDHAAFVLVAAGVVSYVPEPEPVVLALPEPVNVESAEVSGEPSAPEAPRGARRKEKS